MLSVITNFEPGLTDQLIEIYVETIQKQFRDEADFREFCYDSLMDRNCIIFLLNANEEPVSSVFSEMVGNDVLLYSLETAPKHRGKGYAQMLLSGVLDYFRNCNLDSICVHIHKDNQISMDLHQKLGFRTVKDSAKLLDGTVSQRYYTLSYIIK